MYASEVSPFFLAFKFSIVPINARSVIRSDILLEKVAMVTVRHSLHVASNAISCIAGLWRDIYKNKSNN